MDYFELKSTCRLMHRLVAGARVRTCGQDANRTLMLSVKGGCDPHQETTLILDMVGPHSGLYASNERIQGESDTLLARSFRNKLSGAGIKEVIMPYPDRIVCITFQLAEWRNPRQLWLEFMGNFGNAVLVDPEMETILECLTKQPDDDGGYLLRFPGRRFQNAWIRAGRGRQPLSNLADAPSLWPVEESPRDIVSSLQRTWAPMTPELGRSLVRLYQVEGWSRVEKEIRRVTMPEPEAELSCDGVRQRLFSSASIRMTQIRSDRFRNRKQTLVQRVAAAEARYRRSMAAATRDLNNLPANEVIRAMADSLAAAFHRLKPGMAEITVPNVHDPEYRTITIPLNPALYPRDNVDRLFRKAGKTDRAVPRIRQRLNTLQDELAALKSVRDAIESCEDDTALSVIASQLTRAGFAESNTRQINPSAMLTCKPFLRFRSPDGWDVWVGRSAVENDILTFREAAPWDFWLHAHGFRGAHVIARNPGKAADIPDRTARFAAEHAVYFSGARGEKAVPVFLAQRKHVRKAPGNIPGLAIVTRHRTVIVDSPPPPVES
ncbi:DUF814 domain-containing protein [bacterium]|nr:DUF814 domain-containing protein [candidate division CSSED10-310 bacterium]